MSARDGCTDDEWARFIALGMRRPFTQQRYNARARGIEWRFSFGDWCRLWLASGKWKERGRGAANCCMSRNNDCGAYKLGNVSIKSNSDNGREAISKWVGKKKAVRGVFLLYPGSTKPWSAQYGRKLIGLFKTLEEAAKARARYMKANACHTGGAGSGRGWTFIERNTKRPYFMQGPGNNRGHYATAKEARAAYLAACAKHAEANNARHP